MVVYVCHPLPKWFESYTCDGGNGKMLPIVHLHKRIKNPLLVVVMTPFFVELNKMLGLSVLYSVKKGV